MADQPADRQDEEAARRKLQNLATQLREQARQLGDADAIEAADQLHAHAHAETPSGPHIRSALRNLETKIALSPTVNAIAQALSGIGL
jgi:hypothetical protein